jgi:hypothetical protein
MAGVVGLGGAGADEFAALGGVGFGEEAAEGDFGKIGVGVKFRAVFEGEFFGFDHRVQGVGRVVTEAGEIVVLEDVEHLKRGDALTVGRQLVDVVAAVVHGDGLDPGGGVLREVNRRAGSRRSRA